MNKSHEARHLLNQREKGVSIASGFASMKRRMMLRLFLVVACAAFFYFSGGKPIFVLLIGIYLGMTIQDYSWLQSASKSWGFMKTVLNWIEVERIANSDS
ncbi:hypothetical protein [Ferrimonas marina]|nr:hypothetical protein [Ferrimonas marina]